MFTKKEASTSPQTFIHFFQLSRRFNLGKTNGYYREDDWIDLQDTLKANDGIKKTTLNLHIRKRDHVTFFFLVK